MSRRHLLSWLFTLSLLLGQASAFAHAIGHLHKSEGAVPDPVCEVCVAQANLGGAAPATGFSPPAASAPGLAPAPAPVPAARVLHSLAQARAPPAPV